MDFFLQLLWHLVSKLFAQLICAEIFCLLSVFLLFASLSFRLLITKCAPRCCGSAGGYDIFGPPPLVCGSGFGVGGAVADPSVPSTRWPNGHLQKKFAWVGFLLQPMAKSF